MAYIQDTTQNFTIALSALLEGAGLLRGISVINNTTGMAGEWAGTWTTPIPNTTEGDSIAVEITVENNGSVADTLFGEFISAQVTPTSPLQEILMEVGSFGTASWSFTMPANDVSITINAGHVE